LFCYIKTTSDKSRWIAGLMIVDMRVFRSKTKIGPVKRSADAYRISPSIKQPLSNNVNTEAKKRILDSIEALL